MEREGILEEIASAAEFSGFSADEIREISEGATDPSDVETPVSLLIKALLQVRDAVACRVDQGFPDEIIQATFRDLSLRTRHLRDAGEPFGLSPEVFTWSQTYLSGNLVRIGSFQYESYDFEYPLQVYRHEIDGILRAAFEKGSGVEEEFDLRLGKSTGRPWILRDDRWILAASRGSPFLRLHFPLDADFSLQAVQSSIRLALEIFQRLEPHRQLVGICGEAWLFDLELSKYIRNPVIRKLVEIGSFYPSSIPEEKTIRRLFGPRVTRENLPKLPQDSMTSLQKQIITFLGNPMHHLKARGGFALLSELNGLLNEP